MPLQATSGAASYDAFGGGAAAVPNYIEDVFSTYLIKTPGSATAVGAVNNAIDLSTKGGMVWLKDRNFAYSHTLVDSARGVTQRLISNTTDAQASTSTYGFTSFNTNGFTLGAGGGALFDNGASGTNLVSWTFRKQPKFFDVVTYTGNSVDGRTIAHSLGSAPGCIIIKCTSTTGAWPVWQRTLTDASGSYANNLFLNTTDAASNQFCFKPASSQTSTTFAVGNDSLVNGNGATYVAYLFAHNAGGFGLTGTDNVISCGTYTGTTAQINVNLGYEPQWLMVKRSNSTSDWWMQDVMRGWSTSVNGMQSLRADLSNEEITGGLWQPSSTGFTVVASANGASNASGGTYIYIAIRRGPMKVPTVGTSVFAPLAYVGDQSTARRDLDVGFVVDAGLFLNRTRTDYSTSAFTDRLRGAKSLTTNSTSAESDLSGFLWFDDQNGIDVGQIGDLNPVVAGIGQTMVLECFKRAPSFMDVVCYTGTSGFSNITHNLGVAPELMIIKSRSNSSYNWAVYSASSGNANYLLLNTTQQLNANTNYWDSTTPTSSVFRLGSNANVNSSGQTYVAYLFATCAGVSKVGSYTGTATTKQIDCGFTAGARFVLIKRTDSTGDWYVWDTARGIVSGNDSYLLLNSTAAEVTNTDYIDTYSAGFEISSTAPAAINASGGSFIFFAVA